LLVTEAGGTVSTITGDPWQPESDGILATANESLHADMLSLIAASQV
jgi:fructose-1,6-bisphosphatase/inositol monophosphatase family enzyme